MLQMYVLSGYWGMHIMEKEVKATLKKLAQEILENEEIKDIKSLKKQAAKVYEHLAVLHFIEKNNTANEVDNLQVAAAEAEQKMDDELQAIYDHVDQQQTNQAPEIEPAPEEIEESIPPKQPELLYELEDLTSGFDLPDFEPLETPEVIEEPIEEIQLEEEQINSENTAVEDTTNSEIENIEVEAETIEKVSSIDYSAFEKPIEESITEKETINNDTTKSTLNASITKSNSLNESLKKQIKIGLNDRLAFVKHLFNNDANDYTRVISQLNTAHSGEEAQNLISNLIKPEYNNWEGKEEYEARFISIIMAKFDA